MELTYLLPGESNAIDGNIIFEVPMSLTPDKTYVEIVFSSRESALWNLDSPTASTKKKSAALNNPYNFPQP